MNKLPEKTPMLSEEEFQEAVRKMPLVSFDLLLQDSKGRILLGLRKNKPAKGCWFVPGGIIRKNETLADAFSRITFSELGQEISIKSCRLKGVYEHFYDENSASIPDVSTHYIVLAYEIPWQDDAENFPEDQHEEYKWFTIKKIISDSHVHPNTKAYWQKEPV